jgi:Mg-dependent DNase
MIDTHCHIDMFPNPHQIANYSERNNIITIGVTNLPSHFELGLPHIRQYKKIRLALGLHPLYAEKHQSEYDVFKRNIDNTSYIGEVGLDFSREGISTKELQIESLGLFSNNLSAKKNLSQFILEGQKKRY